MRLTRRASEQLALYDRDRVEPEERLWFGAGRYALASISSAPIPQANLVEVMQAECLRNGVDEPVIGYARRHDPAEVEPDEVDIGQATVGLNLSDSLQMLEERVHTWTM